MALYEYYCDTCKTAFEKRMPMSEVKQKLKCAECGKMAKKVLGNFAFVGGADAGFGDGPAPWEDGGMDDFDMGGMGGMDMGGMGGMDMGGMMGGDHGHSH